MNGRSGMCYDGLMPIEDFDTININVQILKDEEGQWAYGVIQEFADGSANGEPQLIESGQADTLEAAAHLAGDAVKRLFV